MKPTSRQQENSEVGFVPAVGKWIKTKSFFFK
jgi:hypothetical protein